MLVLWGFTSNWQTKWIFFHPKKEKQNVKKEEPGQSDDDQDASQDSGDENQEGDDRGKEDADVRDFRYGLENLRWNLT